MVQVPFKESMPHGDRSGACQMAITGKLINVLSDNSLSAAIHQHATARRASHVSPKPGR
jgi:hypothetical protein